MRAYVTCFALIAVLVAAACAFNPSATAADDDDVWKRLSPLSSAEYIFVAQVAEAKWTGSTLSNPGTAFGYLEFSPPEMLRGAQPNAKRFYYQVRRDKLSEFPADKTWVVTAKCTDNRWTVTHLFLADEDLIAKAKVIAALPPGWSVDKGKPLSPWAVFGDKAWPKDALKPEGTACSKTGRPALLAGDDIELSVEQIIPENVNMYLNPYGDGQFKVTVTNRGDKAADVPALLSDGKTIFWADSLFVIYQGQANLLPGAGKATSAKAVRLKPGGSVSTMIDVLPLPCLDERGGGRLYFDFVLGDKMASNFFYYFEKLHTPMREEAIKKAKGDMP